MRPSLSSLRLRGRKKRTPAGASPGTITIAVDARKPQVKVYSYSSEKLEVVQVSSAAEIKEIVHVNDHLTHWIDIKGFGDQELINGLCEVFAIHKLEMEDVINTYQRPKMEEHQGHLFIISRMFMRNNDLLTRNEQLSVFLGNNFVLTMQENDADFFEPVRTRLKEGKGYIRQSGPDYMAYALLDAIVDNYFPLLEAMGERLDELEDELFLKPTRASLQKIQLIKRELILFRRTIFAERDKVNDLLRTETQFVQNATRVFLRDTYDHTIQVMDLVESYKEITASLMDIYLSSVSNRMNQIMKVLAVISTIFIPLTFIVGVYGMNFAPEDPYTKEKYPLNMPELHHPYGYIGVMIFMVLIVAFQLVIFYKRGWLDKT
jgi:magnesium transporter